MFRWFIVLAIIFASYVTSMNRMNPLNFAINSQVAATDQLPDDEGLTPPNPLTNNAMAEEELVDETVSSFFVYHEVLREWQFQLIESQKYKSPFLEKPLQPPRA